MPVVALLLVTLQLLIFCMAIVEPLANRLLLLVFIVMFLSAAGRAELALFTSLNAALFNEDMDVLLTDGSGCCCCFAGATDPDFGNNWIGDFTESFSMNFTQSSAIVMGVADYN